MRKVVFLLAIITLVTKSNSQTFKTEVGDCIECGKEDPRLAIFLGSNSDRVFYYAQGSLSRGMTNYVDVYDAKTLKLVTHCELPEIDKVFRVNAYWENFKFIVNEYGLNVIFCLNTKEEMNRTKTCLIDNNGKLGFVKDVEGTPTGPFPRISGNKNCISFVAIGKMYEAKILKATYSPEGISLTKFSEYSLNRKENENLLSYSTILSNDGWINTIWFKRNIPTIFISDHSGKTSEQPITENDSLSVSFPLSTNKKRTVDDKENYFFTVNEKSKKFGVLELKYNIEKNKYEKHSLNYFDNKLESRFKKKKKEFFLGEEFNYLESFKTDQYIYKNISWQSALNGGNIPIQKGVFVLVYDKENQFKETKLIPFCFHPSFTWRDGGLVDKGKKNYSSVLYKGDLFIFTIESPKNGTFDINNGFMEDFENCTSLSKANFCSYKVSGTKPIERFIVNKETGMDMINIINNFEVHEGYTYVHVIIKDKRYLAKITVQN